MRSNPLIVAMTGMLSLAVAMGIGRFAFTPILPMMLHDGLIGLAEGSWLAMANYLGYWIGAMACAMQPAIWERVLRWSPLRVILAVRIGLIATIALTCAMALHWPAAWALLRFLAGLASAMVFIYTSSWCLGRLAALGTPRLAGIIYVGPGLGILISGLSATAMVSAQMTAALGWILFGVLALCLTMLIWGRLDGENTVQTSRSAVSAPARLGSTVLLILAYGLAGFGYIITATFLPVMARQALPGSVWLDLFWPLFGLAVGLGALMTLRVPEYRDRRLLLMICYLLQAAGVMLTVWWPSLPGFALGSLLLGLPFTAISLFAIQEARRVRPHDAPVFIGLLTASYGLGQIAGPALVGVVLSRSTDPANGFDLSLKLAATALLTGVLIYAWLLRYRQQS